MTPLLIEILLHAHCTPVPHERMYAPAVASGFEELVQVGLIFRDADGIYRTTDRGKAHVEQLCALPFPTSAWIDAFGVPIQI